MNHAKLLDCTLRDGAYLIGKKFGNTTIKGIISGLLNTRVDYIEIGFFQDDEFGDGKTVFKNSSDAKRFIPKDKKGSLFTVLADYSRFSVENLDECDSESIDGVRECFFKFERFDAVNACRQIKNKGYKVFVQPVDILGYTDIELIEFINLINEIEPYCFSIVDTFGSMYQEDLHRIFEIINHNLIPTCKIGFHSHNNMQLSSSLSQEFIRLTAGKRECIIDGTISGMGRGAGNTPTELIAQYMVSQLGYNYDLDALLDTIDGYMDNIRSRCTWGYTTPYFVAGCYSAHVNNISYLSKKNSIRSKDIRFILNKIGSLARKRYDYNLLEQTYMNLIESDIDDTKSIKKLKENIGDKPVLIMLPGNSINVERDKIDDYISNKKPVIITVNFIPENVVSDYIYISNVKRYLYWNQNDKFHNHRKIISSNIKNNSDNHNEIIVSFSKLIKCGWEHLDNSGLMLLRLLDRIGVIEIAIAGFDGYSYSSEGTPNYVSDSLELSSTKKDPIQTNTEIESMLEDYFNTRINKNTAVKFITTSRFSRSLK